MNLCKLILGGNTLMWRVDSRSYKYDIFEEGLWMAECRSKEIAEKIVEEHNKIEFLRKTFPFSMNDFEGCYKSQILQKTAEQERLEMVHKHSE